MRITRKQYEKARAAVEAAREQMKLVKTWDEAVRLAGPVGNQELTAVIDCGDGTYKTEYKLISNGRRSVPEIKQ